MSYRVESILNREHLYHGREHPSCDFTLLFPVLRDINVKGICDFVGVEVYQSVY